MDPRRPWKGPIHGISFLTATVCQSASSPGALGSQHRRHSECALGDLKGPYSSAFAICQQFCWHGDQAAGPFAQTLGDPERALYLALVPLLPVRDQSTLGPGGRLTYACRGRCAEFSFGSGNWNSPGACFQPLSAEVHDKSCPHRDPSNEQVAVFLETTLATHL